MEESTLARVAGKPPEGVRFQLRSDVGREARHRAGAAHGEGVAHSKPWEHRRSRWIKSEEPQEGQYDQVK
jgi:hypothetical protein